MIHTTCRLRCYGLLSSGSTGWFVSLFLSRNVFLKEHQFLVKLPHRRTSLSVIIGSRPLSCYRLCEAACWLTSQSAANWRTSASSFSWVSCECVVLCVCDKRWKCKCNFTPKWPRAAPSAFVHYNLRGKITLQQLGGNVTGEGFLQRIGWRLLELIYRRSRSRSNKNKQKRKTDFPRYLL